MSDLRTEIVSKVLNQWDNGITATPPSQTAASETIAEKVFNFIQAHPSCTSTDVVNGTSVDLGRASATLLALYQKGKVDRRTYPNPNPDGKRDNVFVYWTTVDNYTDKGVHRLIGKAKKPKKVKLTQAKSIEQDILEPIFKTPRQPRIQEFDPEQFVHGLTLTEVKALHKFLEDYFG
jgi:hypothetical protein